MQLMKGSLPRLYIDNQLKWEKEGHVDYNLAFGYAIGHGFHLTQENNFKNVYIEKDIATQRPLFRIGFLL